MIAVRAVTAVVHLHREVLPGPRALMPVNGEKSLTGEMTISMIGSAFEAG